MEWLLVARWLVLYLLFFLAGVPIAATILPRLPDRGAGVALPVAFVLVWLPTYWLGHVSLALGLWVGLFALVAAAALALYRGVDLPRSRVAEPMVVFTVAFLFLVAVRAVDPSIVPGGGEKFLDFGLLKSILRSYALPPEDMWFAGEPVQYYYGGHLLAAILTELTFTPARYAYNLALAGFYAAFVTTAYGIASNVAGHAGASRYVGGGLGAFFAGLASNLYVPAQVVLWALPAPVDAWLVATTQVTAEHAAWTPTDFSYWTASRVIPGTINEFPLFAWLNGDLHAHMMSTPFLLLAATLCLGYWWDTNPTRRRALLFGALPALGGVLAVVNTWSFPSVAGLVFLTAYFAPRPLRGLLPRRLRERVPATESWYVVEPAKLVGAAIVAGVVAALGLVWSLPFWLSTASGRSVVLVSEHSPLWGLLLVHGTFLLVFVPFLGRWVAAERPRREWSVALGVVVVSAALAVLSGIPALGLFGPMLAVAWLALARDRTRTVQRPGYETDIDISVRRPAFETVLVLGGLGLALLVELVYVEEKAGPGRMNTVFKIYAQVWALWAPAAGVAIARLLADPPALPSAFDLHLSESRRRAILSVLAAVLVVSTSFYGGFALYNHFTDSDDPVATVNDPTLDGLEYVDVYHAGESEAIQWLDARIGQPHIVSAPGTSIYRWVNAPSSLTGLPTVAGWVHEVGYRNESAYRQRVDDVQLIYTGEPGYRAYLLDKYDVQYVYVGPIERERYGNVSFEEVPGVSQKVRKGDAVIYEVDQSELG